MKPFLQSRFIRRSIRTELLFIEIVAILVMVGIEAGAGGDLSSGDPGMATTRMVLGWVNGTVLAAFAARIGLKLLRSWRRILVTRHFIACVVVLLALPFSLRLAALFAVIHECADGIRWYQREKPGGRVLVNIHHRPARSLVFSFLGLIGVGTLLLSFPVAASGQAVPLVDALFTAVSAACVTGLITVDTATAWSPFGQGVILVLVQLGGLGIMVISSVMALALGHRLSRQRDAAVRSVFDEPSAEELKYLLRDVAVWTLGIELAGAALLFSRFVFLMPWDEAMVSAGFHAVSAFCNAGFSLYSGSLVRFDEDWVVNLIVMVLVVLGGIGFGVLMGLRRGLLERSQRGLSIHVRLVLLVSLGLIGGAAFLYFFFEYDHSLAHLSFSGKILASFFHSVSARTAGFNTVPLGEMHGATSLVMMILMLIGASPGSTGGGVKTTTILVVFLAVRAFLSDRPQPEILGRRIPDALVLRATALMGTASAVYVVGLVWLLRVEGGEFLPLAFETASALGTSGLSLGVTPTLSVPGKLVVACLMFAGRLGPLTLVAAMSRRDGKSSSVRLPEGKVMIG